MNETLRRELRHVAQAKGINAGRLAKIMGVSRSHAFKLLWAHEGPRGLTLGMVEKLAFALDVDLTLRITVKRGA